jgi:hypothetical protein
MTGQFGPSPIPLPTNCAFTILPAPPVGRPGNPWRQPDLSRSRIHHRCPDQDRTYLTQRFIVADLDGDGNVEVVTVHNRDAARGFVERFRKYTRGRVIALRWNKVNMKEVWTGEEDQRLHQ